MIVGGLDFRLFSRARATSSLGFHTRARKMALAFSENKSVKSVQGLNLPSGTPTTGDLTCVTDQNIANFSEFFRTIFGKISYICRQSCRQSRLYFAGKAGKAGKAGYTTCLLQFYNSRYYLASINWYYLALPALHNIAGKAGYTVCLLQYYNSKYYSASIHYTTCRTLPAKPAKPAVG